MTPDPIATESHEPLRPTLEEAHSPFEEGNLCHSFIYRHARTILFLSKDFFDLEADRTCYSPSIIVRSMLEYLFNLVAAIKTPNFIQARTQQ